MRINGVTLNNFQTNFVKELMNDTHATDVRAEVHFTKVCAKYGVRTDVLLEAVNKEFNLKNQEFKKLEAEDLERN